MAVASSRSSDSAELRAGIEERARAVRAKDVEALMASYADDVATFDLVAPLSNQGASAVRKRLTEWFASFQASIDYEVRDVQLAVAGDVAFDHHFTRVRGTTTSGAKVDMWFRETVGYRRIADRWKVTHQHSSVPFDMASGKPLLDLQPSA
jgi:ketosteroid isomerase-like protein